MHSNSSRTCGSQQSKFNYDDHLEKCLYSFTRKQSAIVQRTTAFRVKGLGLGQSKQGSLPSPVSIVITSAVLRFLLYHSRRLQSWVRLVKLHCSHSPQSAVRLDAVCSDCRFRRCHLLFAFQGLWRLVSGALCNHIAISTFPNNINLRAILALGTVEASPRPSLVSGFYRKCHTWEFQKRKEGALSNPAQT